MAEERTFSDMSGTQWRVREEPASGTRDGEEAPQEPVAYAAHPAALWFTSSGGEQRVLIPVPSNWRTAFADTLAFYCDQARAVDRGISQARQVDNEEHD